MIQRDRPPEVHSFPSQDGEFRRDAQAAVASSWATIRTARALPGEVEARLRIRYPNASVRLRDDATQLDELEVVVYAFRDGRVA